MDLCLSVFVSLFVDVSEFEFSSVFVLVDLCLSLFVDVSVFVLMDVCLSVFVSIFVFVDVSVSVFLSVFVLVDVCLSVFISLFVFVDVCIQLVAVGLSLGHLASETSTFSPWQHKILMASLSPSTEVYGFAMPRKNLLKIIKFQHSNQRINHQVK